MMGAAAMDPPPGERTGLLDGEAEEEERGVADLFHPNGVEPLGNSALKRDRKEGGRRHASRGEGLGYLAALQDEQILQILELLGGRDLARLSLASRVACVFCQHEDLWKGLTLNQYEGAFSFCSSWRATYYSMNGGSDVRPLGVSGLYSDVLFQPYLCSRYPLDPSWLEVNNIPREGRISVEDFIERYEAPNLPVIISGVVSEWEATKRWDRSYLEREYGGARFHCGGYQVALRDYLRYSEASCDDMPLYMFDKHFDEAAPKMAQEYEVPQYFRDDLFQVLGKERPDYRWLIMGPKRSGSTFHQDPNQTSAWNACIRGRKKWVMFPPSCPPPGVHPSEDGADVACPVSLIEWFMDFYEAAREAPVRPLEGIVEEGELLFVPRGWWHMVLNLEDSIAITQNFVSPRNLRQVLAFISRPNAVDVVSGCPDEERATLAARFETALERDMPEVLAACRAAEAAIASSSAGRLHSLFAAGGAAAGPAAEGGGGSGGGGGGFTFGFDFSGAPAGGEGGGSFKFGFDLGRAE